MAKETDFVRSNKPVVPTPTPATAEQLEQLRKLVESKASDAEVNLALRGVNEALLAQQSVMATKSEIKVVSDATSTANSAAATATQLANNANTAASTANQKVTTLEGSVANTAEVMGSVVKTINTLNADLSKKASADALTALTKDYTDQKRIRNTSTQTVTNRMRVTIPHGIAADAPVPAMSRVLKLNALTEVAGGYSNATVDAANINVYYDVTLNTEPDGWVMQWEL